jgi:hypothetical protein
MSCQSDCRFGPWTSDQGSGGLLDPSNASQLVDLNGRRRTLPNVVDEWTARQEARPVVVPGSMQNTTVPVNVVNARLAQRQFAALQRQGYLFPNPSTARAIDSIFRGAMFRQ